MADKKDSSLKSAQDANNAQSPSTSQCTYTTKPITYDEIEYTLYKAAGKAKGTKKLDKRLLCDTLCTDVHEEQEKTNYFEKNSRQYYWSYGKSITIGIMNNDLKKYEGKIKEIAKAFQNWFDFSEFGKVLSIGFEFVKNWREANVRVFFVDDVAITRVYTGSHGHTVAKSKIASDEPTFLIGTETSYEKIYHQVGHVIGFWHPPNGEYPHSGHYYVPWSTMVVNNIGKVSCMPTVAEKSLMWTYYPPEPTCEVKNGKKETIIPVKPINITTSMTVMAQNLTVYKWSLSIDQYSVVEVSKRPKHIPVDEIVKNFINSIDEKQSALFEQEELIKESIKQLVSQLKVIGSA